MLKLLLSLGILATATARAACGAELTPQQQQFFESEVRPLLAERCHKCHGPEEQNGSLRLDSLRPMLTGGDSGPAVVPGHPEKSLLLKAVSYNDTNVQMPPDGKLPDDKVAILSRWIQMGAPWPRTADDGPLAPRKEFEITDEDRRHWSFQPVERPELPRVEGSGFRVQGSATKGEPGALATGERNAQISVHPIDAFVLARLEAKGLSLNPPAHRRELVRRAYFDLLGLPPSPEEVDTFVADDAPYAYEHLIDRLLESPQYGERWGRHWLDLVRYAQSNGYERDDEKPEAWRYRDYIIQAFNDDKPYDRFILEQLAGDELPDVTPESVIATGFLRLGVWDDEPDDKSAALWDEYDDMVRTASEAFLGLTVGCARCHDHKFDPIAQEDYYRLAACFRSLVPFSRKQIDSAGKLEQDAPYVPVLEGKDLAQRLEIKNEIERLQGEGGSPGQKREWIHRLEQSLRKSGALALAARENGGTIPPTHVLVRGNAHSPAAEVTPGVPKVLEPITTPAQFDEASPADQNSEYRQVMAELGVAATSGRRLALARWIAEPNHPLTVRVMANRLWQYHFGRGIVPTPNDYGHTGQAASNLELLDYLASELIANGWRLKALHKQIMLSSTYRQSSRIGNQQAASVDPDNALCWRQNVRRLDAESLRDSILAVSGRLNLQMGGRGFFPTLSPEVLATQSRPGNGWDKSSAEEQSRRSIYMFVKRTLRVPLMEALDQPASEFSAPSRPVTTIAPQALMLLNSKFIDDQSAALAERLQRECGAEISAQIEQAYRLALGRKPREDELSTLCQFVDRQHQIWAANEKTKDSANQKSLAAVCKLIFNLNEFAYVD